MIFLGLSHIVAPLLPSVSSHSLCITTIQRLVTCTMSLHHDTAAIPSCKLQGLRLGVSVLCLIDTSCDALRIAWDHIHSVGAVPVHSTSRFSQRTPHLSHGSYTPKLASCFWSNQSTSLSSNQSQADYVKEQQCVYGAFEDNWFHLGCHFDVSRQMTNRKVD